MKKTIGIFAHVDAGKTTFSEQLLYQTGSIRSLGRVDHRNSYMDTDELEQKRGITIFADQAVFSFRDDTYYLIDTPGHVDFSAETERAISALDYAIVLIGGNSGVQAHTATLFRLLESYGVPVFFFINKSDIEGFDIDYILNEIKYKLTEDLLYIEALKDILNKDRDIAEFTAERDEAFLEYYLEEDYSGEFLLNSIAGLVKERKCYPVMSGAALKGIGIDKFLEVFSNLTPTYYRDESGSFTGRVYKIRHDEGGSRITFIKALTGCLHVRDEFSFEQNDETYAEKVNEIRIYNGKKYESKNIASAGDIFAVTGLKTPICGTVLQADKITQGNSGGYLLIPTLKSKVNILDGTDITVCIGKLRILEAEDPMLSVSLNEESGEIIVSVMGKIQLEVLEQLITKRFGISVSFEKPQVQYRETVSNTIVGYGHFEPLRHYAEVQLRLEPNPRGKGITFASECHVDTLAVNYQRLIKSHAFEKAHKGVLTGSPVTDMHIVLQNGRAHIKHTAGGDFREATYRAIRQGLEKAESALLEPFYKFEIYIDETYIGRVLSDIQKMRGNFEAPVRAGNNVCIRGRGPVETFMEYSMELVSFTKGTGCISFMFDGYDVCTNSQEVIKRIGYDKGADTGNTSASVFCAKGTSFVVNWDEAENFMHTKE